MASEIVKLSPTNVTNASSTTMFDCELPFDHDKELLLFDNYTFINRIILVVVQSLLFVPTIIFNAVIIIAMVKNRNLWRSATILIGFLAITDAFVGICSMPLLLSTVVMELVYGEKSVDTQAYCTLSKVTLYAGDLGMGLSFITISLITFERYVAIFWPFWYRKHVRTSAIIKTTIFIWLLWAFLVVVLILNVSFELIVGVVILVLVILVYLLALPVYVRIVLLLNKIEAMDASTSKIDRKGSITCAIMVICLLLCYTPLIVFAIVIVANGGTKSAISYAFPWTRVLVLSNSFFNPLIYLARNHTIRRATRDILKKFFKKAGEQTVCTPTNQPEHGYGITNTAAVISREVWWPGSNVTLVEVFLEDWKKTLYLTFLYSHH